MLNQQEANRIAKAVNTSGGRTKNIIEVQKCVCCEQIFFSQIQEVIKRFRTGSIILCPTCRTVEEKNQKKYRSALHYEIAKFLANPNIIPDGEITKEQIDRWIEKRISISSENCKTEVKGWELWSRIINGLLPDERKDVKFLCETRRISYLSNGKYIFQQLPKEQY